MGASWGVSEASWDRLGASCVHLGCVLGPLGGVLEASWGRLGPPWGLLGAYIGVLKVSGRHLVPDFQAKRWPNLGMLALLPFINRFLHEFSSENRSLKFTKSLSSMGKIIVFSFQAVLT